jgi:hypothetical protein
VEAIGRRFIPAHRHHTGHSAITVHAREVDHLVDREGDRFAHAVARQFDIRGQHAVRHADQRLVWGIRMDRAETSQVAGVERLQQIERFGSPDFTDEDPIGPMAERGPEQVGNGHRWERRFVAQGRLRASSLQALQIRLLEMNL